MAKSDIIKLAKSVKRWAASVAIAKLFDKTPPIFFFIERKLLLKYIFIGQSVKYGNLWETFLFIEYNNSWCYNVYGYWKPIFSRVELLYCNLIWK